MIRGLVRSPVLLLLLTPVCAVSQQPARWLETSTEHVRIVYRADQQAVADELVSFAEEAYEEVTALFGTRPRRVDVVVYGATDLANGYYSPAPPQHIGLYPAHPSLQFLGARTDSWLKALFVHELTHFVQANYDRGFFWWFGSIFGRSLSGLSLGPVALWTVEGIAVNTETNLTMGGRGRDPYFESLYKAPAVEGNLLSLWQAGYDSHLAPPGRYYVAGYLIWEHLIREYGSDVVSDFVDRYARFPFFGVWGPIRRATGVPVRETWARIEVELAERYAVSTLELAALPDDRISPAIRSDYYLPTATEAGLYLYRTRPDRLPAIVRLDPASGEETPLVEVRLTDHASWSATADGLVIAFATVEADLAHPDEPMVRSRVYLHDTSDGTTHPVTVGGFHQPGLSPDGAFLVAVERIGSYQRLSRVDLTGERAGSGPLLELDRTTFAAPEVSPDGKSVVVTANRDGTQIVLLVDAQSGEFRILPHPEGGTPYFPTFDGLAAVTYASDRGGTLALYRHDLADDRITLLAVDPVGVHAGRRVGDSLVVSTYRSDGHSLRMLPAPDGLSTVEARQGGPDAALLEPVPSVTPALPPPGAQPETAASRRYRAFPSPTVWFPAFDNAGFTIDAETLGFGAFVGGSDLLERHQWQLSAVYFPALTQFSHMLDWYSAYGGWIFAAGSDSSFLLDDERNALQVFRGGMTIGRVLGADYSLGVLRSVAISAGVAGSIAFGADAPFTVVDLGAVDDRSEALLAGVRVSAVRRPSASRRAHYVPGELSVAAGLTVPFPGPDFPAPTVLGELSGRAHLPLGGDHVLALQPAVRLAGDPAYLRPFDLTGFEGRTDHTAFAASPAAYRVSLAWRTPLALFDRPLASGVGLTGFGFSLLAETTGGIGANGITPSPAVAIGTELLPVVTFRTAIPISIGVLARFYPFTEDRFFVGRDLGFYVRPILQMPRLSFRDYY